MRPVPAIDLHMHTTASDGRSTPAGLVSEAVAAGIGIMAVTDHDTTAGWDEASAAAAAAGVTFIPGIEITAVADGRDVHMLGYGFNREVLELVTFLATQRQDRRRRLQEIGERLAELGVPVDLEAAIAARGGGDGEALGRPIAAAALVEAGHVRDIKEAFERFLADGRPAFIERLGASPAEVVALITRLGGVAAMAHPGKTRRDDLIPSMVAAGMPALEVYHPDHDPADTRRYRALAASHNLLPTGGSDYHGPGSGRADGLGAVQLPAEDFDRLAGFAGWPARS